MHDQFVHFCRLSLEIYFWSDVLPFLFDLFKNVLIFFFDFLGKNFVFTQMWNFQAYHTFGFSFIDFLHFPDQRPVLQNDGIYLLIAKDFGLFISGDLKGILLDFFVIEGLFETRMLAKGVGIFEGLLMIFEAGLRYFLVDGVVDDGSGEGSELLHKWKIL